jgi:DNA-binding NarL/FixJ family response regulator
MRVAGRTRVLLVERRPVLTPEIRDALGAERSFDLLARVGSAAEATRLAREQPPDLVIARKQSCMPTATGGSGSTLLALPARE